MSSSAAIAQNLKTIGKPHLASAADAIAACTV